MSALTCRKMAEARISVEQFLCPVCLDLLTDPVTIQCGHSYCKSCITDCWNEEDKKSLAALSADRPSVQDLLYLRMWCLLKCWINWRRLNFKVWFLLKLEMFSVTSVLEENTKPSSPVWCVWTLTVRITSNNMRVGLKERDTIWLKPLDDCRRWSARNMRSF